jgi:hypothetical protein
MIPCNTPITNALTVSALTRFVLREQNGTVPLKRRSAGTSVAQIQRFYARNLPLSREMAINLQTFGGDTDQRRHPLLEFGSSMRRELKN